MPINKFYNLLNYKMRIILWLIALMLLSPKLEAKNISKINSIYPPS